MTTQGDDTTNRQATPTGPNPDYEPMLQFFEYDHLPAMIQGIIKPFHDLAHDIANHTARNPERSACLRKLLEAQDCAVRANLYR